MPGPGTYEANVTDLSMMGKFTMASIQGSTVFDHSKRVTEFDDAKKKSRAIPGPGSYRLSSDFGQYDGVVYGRETSVGVGNRR